MRPMTSPRACSALVASACLAWFALPASAQDGAGSSGYVLNEQETRELAVYFADVFKNQIGAYGPLVEDPRFLEGFDAALFGASELTDDDYRKQLRALSDEVNAAIIARQEYDDEVRQIEQVRWLAEVQEQPGATLTRNGVIMVYRSEGLGQVPPPDATVKVHYHGTLSDGTVFDSSINRGPPETLSLPGLIDGWREAMASMPVGSVVDVYIPSDLAYRDLRVSTIPPHSALAFRIHLLGTVEGE